MYYKFTGAFVLGVTAIDGDLGENGQITYTLTGADANSFNIDSATGIITAKRTLVGKPSGYTFAVKATDHVNIIVYLQMTSTLNVS